MTAPITLDPSWREHTYSPKQRALFDAVLEHGTLTAGAAAIGMDLANASKMVKAIKYRAQRAEIGGAIGPGPERDGGSGYIVKGVSTYFDRDGEQRGQWVKTKLDAAAWQDAIRAEIASLTADAPRLPPLQPPGHVEADLLNFFVITDYHIGMRAWSEEGGSHWDLATAERLLIEAVGYMVQNAPPAAVGFIAQLGDFLHFDGLLAVTPTHGHVLDAAGQYQEIVRVVIRVMRALVDMALRKYGRVVVLAAEGNHDLSGSVWLRELLKVLYEAEPRIEILDCPSPYYAYEWGKTMLAVHHGHMKNNEALAMVFAAGFSEMWGRTKKRYAHAGHRHHEVVVKEVSGMKTIQHPTLAPADSHSARHGYFSERQTSVTTYHARFGKIGELICTPEMLAA